MKNIFLLIATTLLLISCRENMPVIPPLGPPDLGDRKVLIEEFTGVRCVNCPQGSAEILNLQGLYGENLIAISIHAGFFSPPYPESQYDFRTDDGGELLTFLGEPLGYPSAVINRNHFDGQFDLQNGQATWAGFIEAQASIPPAVNIVLSSNFNESDRVIAIKATLIANEQLGDNLRLTVMLTENDVADAQLTPDGLKTDYKHKHVLRDVITNFDGDILGDIGVGELVAKNFSYTLPEEWSVDNCNVVAFVHLAGEEKDVLQVEEVHVLD